MAAFSNFGLISRAHSGHVDALAVVEDPDGTAVAVTYADFESRCARRAAVLAPIATPGTRVAVVGENSVDYLAAVLGAARIGAIAVPMGPRQGQAALHAIIEEASPVVALVDDASQSLLPPTVSRVSLRDAPAGEVRDVRAAVEVLGGQDIALQMYTSGSTGTPKGVLLSHDALLWPIRTLLAGPPMSSTVVVVAAPLFHMNGLQTAMATLAQGGTVCLLPRFDAGRYVTAVERQRATVLVGVPTMFSMILDEIERRDSVDMTSVVAIMSASAPLSDELYTRIQLAFPDAMVRNVYGTTEAFGMFGPHRAGLPTPPNSIGAAQADVDVRLVDGPSEVQGRLLVRTPASMQGYHDNPTATSAKLIDGWYDTGDIVRVDEDGFYFVIGRADDMIICGGENLYPSEVEAVLESHPAVRVAAVVPVADPVKGQVPVAFVVPEPSAAIDGNELRRYYLEHGPAYSHPRRVEVLDSLPLTGTGKVDKRALADSASQLDISRTAT